MNLGKRSLNTNKIRGGVRSERMNRRLKSVKDKRTIPISTKLYEAIKDMPLINDCDDPIWLLDIKLQMMGGEDIT